MKTRKIIKLLIRSGIILGVFAFVYFVTKIPGISYAVPASLPSANFTSNFNDTSGVILNFVNDAISLDANVRDNFAVAKGLKDNSETYPLYYMSKNLEAPSTKETYSVAGGGANITDKGLNHLLKIGYNNTDSPNIIFNRSDMITKNGQITDNTIKQYVTQVAIWLYIYKNKSTFSTTYCANHGCDFYQRVTPTGSNPAKAQSITYENALNYVTLASAKTNYKYLGYISDMIAEAEEAKTAATPTTDVMTFQYNKSGYTVNKTNKTLKSATVTPKLNDESRFVSYSITLNDPNKYGAYLVKEDGTVLKAASGTGTTTIGNLGKDVKFAIVCPYTDDLSSYDFRTVTATMTVTYTTDDSTTQGKEYSFLSTTDTYVATAEHPNLRTPTVIYNLYDEKVNRFPQVVIPYVTNTSKNYNITLENITVIKKVLDGTSTLLGGAKLELYNYSDIDASSMKPKNNASPIDSWTTVQDQTYKVYLSHGHYAVCEKEAPPKDGDTEYIKLEECIDFTIEESGPLKEVTVPNSIFVPDTASRISKLSYILGGILTLGGITGIGVITIRKRKNNTTVTANQ